MGTHTPGPWNTNIVGRHIYIEASLRPYVYQEVACCGPTEHVDQQEANAFLIAAAPDLLEALIDARKQLEAYEEALNGEDYNSPRINEAIAKATGGEQ